MSRDTPTRSRAELGQATNRREREAADLRAYADHREPGARERLIRSYLPLANSIARRFDRGQRLPPTPARRPARVPVIRSPVP